MIDLLKYTKRQIDDILLTYYGGGITAPDIVYKNIICKHKYLLHNILAA